MIIQVSEFHPRISISKSLPLLAPKPGNNSVFTNNSQVCKDYNV